MLLSFRLNLTNYFARFVDFTATLWHLEATLDLIFEQGLVPQNPQMGLFILDPADAASGSFQVYLGEEGTRMEAFAHLLDRPGDISVIEAEEFITSVIHQKKGMRNGPSTQPKANVDPEPGIRHGVIRQHSVMPEALDDFGFDYGQPRCPKCGEEVSADDVGQYDFLCNMCNYEFSVEDAYPEEPLGFHYDQDGYFFTNCFDNDILILRSNFYTFAQFYNPCMAGAGNLDTPMEEGVKTYALSHDWFEGGIALYPVYRVSGDMQIVATKETVDYDQCDGTGKNTLQGIQV